MAWLSKNFPAYLQTSKLGIFFWATYFLRSLKKFRKDQEWEKLLLIPVNVPAAGSKVNNDQLIDWQVDASF